MEIEAVRLPVALGVNVTLMVQLAFTASDVPQVFVCAKSPLFVPVTVMPEIPSAPVPLLVKVTVCAAAEAPTNCVPSAKLVLLRFAVPALGVPAPLRLMA